jgi:hypothetical protein
VVGQVISKGRKDLQGHPYLGSRFQKRKPKKISLSQTQDIEVESNNVNLQVDEDLLASLNSSSVHTTIVSFADVILKGGGD